MVSLKKFTPPVPPPEEKLEVPESKPVATPKAKPKPAPKPKKISSATKPKISPAEVAPMAPLPNIPLTPRVEQKKSEANKPQANVTRSEPDTQEIMRQKTQYFTQLSLWLEQHKTYPSIARRRNQQGEVVIQFTINAEGELLRHHLATPSQHNSLNKATRSMVEKAAPLPPVPPILRGAKSQFTYTIPVKFKLDK